MHSVQTELIHHSNHPRRRWRRWRWPLYALSGLLAIEVSYQIVGSVLDQRRYPALGQLVPITTAVRPTRLHLHCVGTGSPTVILDHVADSNSAQWACPNRC